MGTDYYELDVDLIWDALMVGILGSCLVQLGIWLTDLPRGQYRNMSVPVLDCLKWLGVVSFVVGWGLMATSGTLRWKSVSSMGSSTAWLVPTAAALCILAGAYMLHHGLHRMHLNTINEMPMIQNGFQRSLSNATPSPWLGLGLLAFLGGWVLMVFVVTFDRRQPVLGVAIAITSVFALIVAMLLDGARRLENRLRIHKNTAIRNSTPNESSLWPLVPRTSPNIVYLVAWTGFVFLIGTA